MDEDENKDKAPSLVSKRIGPFSCPLRQCCEEAAASLCTKTRQPDVVMMSVVVCHAGVVPSRSRSADLENAKISLSRSCPSGLINVLLMLKVMM